MMKAEDRRCWWKTFPPNLPLLFASWKSGNSPHISETNDLHWTNPAWGPAEQIVPSLEGWASVGACDPTGSAASQPANLEKNRQGSDRQPQSIWKIVFRLRIIFPWKMCVWIHSCEELQLPGEMGVLSIPRQSLDFNTKSVQVYSS